MIKILNVIGSLNIGGAENNAMNVLRFIDTTKFSYHFLVFGDDEGDYEAEAVSLGAKIIHLNEPKQDYKKFMADYKELLKKEKYDAVHVNTLWNSGLLLRTAKKTGVPLRICHSHSTESSQNETVVYKVYKTVMQRLILKNATQYIACGRDAGEYLYGKSFFSRYGEVIYNGIDEHRFTFDSLKRKTVRDSLSIDQDDVVLGHVGRVAPVKNHMFMIQILEQLSGELENLKLVLIGDGPDLKAMKKLVGEKGLDKKVLFLGNQQNVSDYLHAFDLFIFPSLFEGFPVSLIEAQAASLPCLISTRVTQETKLTEQTHFIDLENSDGWLEKIRFYAKNELERSTTVGDEIKNKFSIYSIVKKWEHVYEEKNEGLYNGRN